MSVIVVFEGREITGLSQKGAEAFVKQNKGAHIKGQVVVAPIEKKNVEVAAEDNIEQPKRTRTRKPLNNEN
jgi:hypothetical protein